MRAVDMTSIAKVIYMANNSVLEFFSKLKADY